MMLEPTPAFLKCYNIFFHVQWKFEEFLAVDFEVYDKLLILYKRIIPRRSPSSLGYSAKDGRQYHLHLLYQRLPAELERLQPQTESVFLIVTIRRFLSQVLQRVYDLFLRNHDTALKKGTLRQLKVSTQRVNGIIFRGYPILHSHTMMLGMICRENSAAEHL